MSLYAWIEDMLRPCVAQRRSVLIQKIHQLFGDLSEKKKRKYNSKFSTNPYVGSIISFASSRRNFDWTFEQSRWSLSPLFARSLGNKFLLGGMKKFFSPVGILRFTMLPTEVFGNLFRREFGFADIAEVSGKVNGFSCKKKKKKKKERRQDIKRLAMGISITQPCRSYGNIYEFFVARLRLNGEWR